MYPRHHRLPQTAIEGAARLAARVRLNQPFRKDVLRRFRDPIGDLRSPAERRVCLPGPLGRGGPISAFRGLT